MAIDIVIPLGRGSYWQNNELKYCLRGIEKHLKNYRDIYIIGEFPEFLGGPTKEHSLIHIPHVDKHNHERNIYEKIKRACQIPDLSEDFFFMNDDHFLIRETDTKDYPYYFKSTLTEKIDKRARNDGYCISMRNTRDVLRGRPETCFDIHTPIIYNKTKFKALESVDWTKGMGYVIKSLYCNLNDITGLELDDLKIKAPRTIDYLHEKIQDRHVFSIADSSINYEMGIFMEQLYPDPSRFEKKPKELTRKQVLRKMYYETKRMR